MNREFDQFAAGYSDILNASIALSGHDSAYFDEYKVREVHRVVAETPEPSPTATILNFGCGVGNSERFLSAYFPASAIYSIDTSPESIRIAKERNLRLKAVSFAVCDSASIPFDVSFDLIFCAGVFHHISPDQRISTLVSLMSKLSPAGRLFIFEHNPWNPVTRRVVSRCPLDENARLISPAEMGRMLRMAGFDSIVRRFIVFFPRWLGVFAPLERYLGLCPLGAQYYMTASRRGR